MRSKQIPQSKEPFSLAESVEPDSTVTVESRVVDDGTLEDISIRIYPGPELELQIRVFIRRGSGSGSRIPLIQTGDGKEYIDGDNDKWTWTPNKPLERDDVIEIETTNLNDTETYDFRVNLDVDYRNGLRSFFSRGVFS